MINRLELLTRGSIKNIRVWTGLDFHTLLSTTQEREEFAKIVASLQWLEMAFDEKQLENNFE